MTEQLQLLHDEYLEYIKEADKVEKRGCWDRDKDAHSRWECCIQHRALNDWSKKLTEKAKSIYEPPYGTCIFSIVWWETVGDTVMADFLRERWGFSKDEEKSCNKGS